MANLKSYSEMRMANLDENRRMLLELGVRLPTAGNRVVLKKPKPPPKRPKPKAPEKVPVTEPGDEDGEKKPEETEKLGRSFRFRIKPKYYQEEVDVAAEAPQPRVPRIKPDNRYGKIPGVEVGREWETRIACSYDEIHRPTVAGIHPGPDGAYSVALSGGYEDDVDFGESFTYTGEGGRDLKGTAANPKNLRTAPQSKDQTLERGNLALSRNVETQNPVRVVRGYKLDSVYAPEWGYRYDGLYQVKKYWAARGKSGFKVWKFAFVRCDSEPAPWSVTEDGFKSPLSPTTPTSIPRTGVEACEAPSLEEDESEDNSQPEEAREGAKQPEERRRKKVSFSTEDSVRFFEKEEREEDKPGRMSTRSSAKAEEEESEEESEEEELKAPQVRERSKRAVKPTPKVLENLLLKAVKSGESPQLDLRKTKQEEDTSKKRLVEESPHPAKKKSNEGPPKEKKSGVSPSLKKNSEETTDDQKKSEKSLNRIGSKSETPKRASNKDSISKSPVDDKAKGKSPSAKKSESPENNAKNQSVSPEDLAKVSSTRKKSQDRPKKMDEKQKRSSLQNQSASPEDLPKGKAKTSPKSANEVKSSLRKRSISPEYPPLEDPSDGPPQLSLEGKPRRRSVSTEYPPEGLEDFCVKKSKTRSVSPEERRSSENKRRTRSVSPEYLPPDLDKYSPNRAKAPPEKTAMKQSPTAPVKRLTKSPKKASPKNSSPMTRRSSEQQTKNEPVKTPSKVAKSPQGRTKNESSKVAKSPGERTKNASSKVAKSPGERTKNESSKVAKSPGERTKNESVNPPSKVAKSPKTKTVSKRSLSPVEDPDDQMNNAEVTETAATSQEEEPKKRGKGRARKNPVAEEVSLNGEVSDTDEAPTSPEAKRGSPRKEPASEEVSFNGEVSHSESTEVPISPKATEEVPAKRKRLHSEETSLSEEHPRENPVAEEVSLNCEVSTDEALTSPEAKRGSPRKDPVSEEVTLNDEVSDSRGTEVPISPKASKEAPVKRKRLLSEETSLSEEPSSKRAKQELPTPAVPTPDTLTPPDTETSNSNSSGSGSPALSANSRCDSPVPEVPENCQVSEKCDVPAEVDQTMEESDDEDFPSDAEIMGMMTFSLSSCTGDGRKVTVRMVNGKWIEEEH